MSFSMEDVMEVIQIVKACKDTELHIDTGEIKLSIFKGDVGNSAGRAMAFAAPAAQNAQPAAVAPAPASAPAAAPVCHAEPAEGWDGHGIMPDSQTVCEVTAASAPKAEEISEEGLVPVKASVTSVFYRKPSPEEPAFVEVGDEVQEDTVLCLLEVMKCYRQVMAETKGTIAKICVESNSLVERGSTLFLIKP